MEYIYPFKIWNKIFYFLGLNFLALRNTGCKYSGHSRKKISVLIITEDLAHSIFLTCDSFHSSLGSSVDLWLLGAHHSGTRITVINQLDLTLPTAAHNSQNQVIHHLQTSQQPGQQTKSYKITKYCVIYPLL